MNKVTADEMRAVPQSRVMSIDFLFDDFDRLIQSPESVHRLRRFILDLAVRGKLLPQDPNDEPASELLKRIAVEKARLVKAGKIRKEKSLPEIAPDEIPFGAPQGWEWVRLASSTIIVQGFAFSSGDFSIDPNAGYPLIKIGDIGTSTPEVFIEGPYDPAYLVNRGDILVGLSGSIKCAIWEGPTALLNQRIARIAPSSSHMLSAWLLFGVNACIDKWKDETSKLTVQNVKARQLYESLIPLPPLAEQHRIVTKVDELMALCDRLEAARAEREATRDRLAAASLTRLNAPDPDPAMFQHDVAFALNNLIPLTTRPDQIKALRQTTLNLAVRGKLVPQDPNDEPASELLKRIAAEKTGLIKNREIREKKPLPPIEEANEPFPVPPKWVWTPLGNLFHLVTDGTHYTPRYIDKGVPFLSVKDVSSGAINFSNIRHISEDQHRELCKRCCPEKGDILLTKVGTTGIAVPIKTERAFSIFVSVALLKFSADNLSQDYLCHLLNSPFVRQQSKDNTQGIGNQNLVLRLINGFVLPIPPLTEQHRIVAKVDELMTLCDRLEASLSTGDETQGRLVEAVLHKLLSGDKINASLPSVGVCRNRGEND